MILPQKHSPAAPLEHIKRRPWSFAALALATGFSVGMLIRFRTLRNALKVYGLVRRIV